MTQELSLVFPTPILTRTLFTHPFNEKLARLVLAHRRNGEGRRVNGGGWQSECNLLAWPEQEVKLLAAEVFRAAEQINTAHLSRSGLSRPHDAQRSAIAVDTGLGTDSSDECVSVRRNCVPYRGRAWANVNGDGHYDPPRVQPGYQWCAIYHVATGRRAADRVQNGTLEIMDPRPGASFGQLEKFAFGHPLEIEPKAGLVVIFPAWLQYCVHPFFGMGHRISITMNISVEEE
jgi:hypothetical protein